MAGVFRGGVPLAPDISRLLAAYPEIVDGTVISYDEVAATIGAAATSNRWRTVVTAWRRVLERPPYSRRLLPDPSTRTFRAMSGDEHVRHADHRQRRKLLGVVREGTLAGMVPSDRLSAAGMRARDHVVLRGATISGHLRMEEGRPKVALPAART